MPPARRLAWSPVPLFAARTRIVAAVAPLDPLNLKPGAYDTGVQVHIRPAEPESLVLADTQSKSDRPPGTIPPGPGDIQDAPRLLKGQRLDLGRSGR
jgi:hypothetical protein